VILRFLDGTEHRVAELRRIVPDLELELANLPVGFATAAPDPAQRARDMVLADDHGACFAEAVDLTTMDGQSLRLELDTENDNRFCRWRRETPARLHLCVALRRAAGADVELFAAECEGRIADQPAGPKGLGWDRLFVPDGFAETLAMITSHASTGGDPDPVGLRTLVYGDLVAALAAQR
jgi:inosine/xanthosine triphosphate pyrophosphatase family protein